jgi:hypothetical protein
VTKSRRITWARHVVCTGEKIKAFRTFVGKLEGKRALGIHRDTTTKYLRETGW